MVAENKRLVAVTAVTGLTQGGRPPPARTSCGWRTSRTARPRPGWSTSRSSSTCSPAGPTGGSQGPTWPSAALLPFWAAGASPGATSRAARPSATVISQGRAAAADYQQHPSPPPAQRRSPGERRARAGGESARRPAGPQRCLQYRAQQHGGRRALATTLPGRAQGHVMMASSARWPRSKAIDRVISAPRPRSARRLDHLLRRRPGGSRRDRGPRPGRPGLRAAVQVLLTAIMSPDPDPRTHRAAPSAQDRAGLRRLPQLREDPEPDPLVASIPDRDGAQALSQIAAQEQPKRQVWSRFSDTIRSAMRGRWQPRG